MNDKSNRRDFLKTSGLLTASAVVAATMPTSLMVHAAGSDVIKIGVIGCGGRGTGAAINAIEAGGNIKIVAVGDAFEPSAKKAAAEITKQGGAKADIPQDRIFWGLDAYLKVLACDIDMVIIAGPPGFRPQHFEAAVKAGKHIFTEKPVCVCAGGFRKFMEANKIAEQKNLKVVVGLQRHHQASYMGAMEAIKNGEVGDVHLIRAYWNGDGIWNRSRQEGQTEMQYQVNNWYHFVWLSGDNICEQHVHNLDVANWIMSTVLNKTGKDWAHPVEANGMGACLTRGYNGKDCQGQIFDAHFIEYTYENGMKMYSQCRHQPYTWNNVSEALHSSKKPAGINVESIGEKIKLKFSNPYVQEHLVLQQAIVNNEKHHEGWYGAISTMTAVLGRNATYSGRLIKWDDLVKNGPDTFPAGTLSWDGNPPVMPDDRGFYPIPTPGQFKPFPDA